MNPELNVFAFISGLYGTALNNAVTQNVQAGLQFSHGWLRAAAAVWILATAIMALMQNLGTARLIQRLLRVLIISALITSPDLYTRFVVQPVMTGIPNQIARTFGGPAAQTMPDQFASIYSTIGNMASQLRTEASGILYIADRFAIWFAELCCKFLLVPEFVLYVVLQLFTALVVIAGTLVLIFYMFDATKSFAEAWIGTVVGCLVTTALMSITMQMVLQMITTYIQKIGALPVSSHGFGINVTEGAEVLINIAVMFIVGFFLMVMAFILGFAIGRSAGINASAVLQRFARPV